MSDQSWTRKQAIHLDADALDKKRKRQESEAALIFALLIGACAAFGIILYANSEPSDEPTQVSDCTTIKPEQARLACFDTLVRSGATPFKGEAPLQLDKPAGRQQ